MPRKTVGAAGRAANNTAVQKEDAFDYGPLISPGVTLLKFGRKGKPHERLFKLSGDMRYLKWYSGWLTSLADKDNTGIIKVICFTEIVKHMVCSGFGARHKHHARTDYLTISKMDFSFR